jgi:hypothetical protein
MLGDKDEAKQNYGSCVAFGRQYLAEHQDPDVDYFVTQSEQRLAALETE